MNEQLTPDYETTPSGLQEHVLERKGCPIHYWMGGQVGRPVLVCLHGATMDHRMFNAQAPAVQDEYAQLVWDARGHGQSRPMGEMTTISDYVNDLVAVLDDAGLERVVLVGQSLGGLTAQHFYRRYPERVQAMVVIGATPIAFPLAFLEMTALQYTVPMFRVWPWDSLKSLVARTIAVKPEVRRYALEVMNSMPKEDFLHIWSVVTTAVSRTGYPEHKIHVPLLLTHGEHDVTGTIRRDAPRWAAYEPDVRWEVIPDAGHNANQDNWQVFNPLLLDFLHARLK